MVFCRCYLHAYLDMPGMSRLGNGSCVSQGAELKPHAVQRKAFERFTQRWRQETGQVQEFKPWLTHNMTLM